MKVSIIIPAYNCEKWIEQCIYSTVNQSYSNLEIIVVNDGSKDNTLNILKELKKKDHRIIIIDKENSGTYLTRRLGVQKSTGEAIFHADSDDTLEPKAIELLVDKMLKTGANLVIGNHYHIISGKSKIIENKFPEKRTKTELVRSLLDNQIKGYLWGKLFKRELMLNIDLDINFIMYEDLMVNLYIFIKKDVVVEKIQFPIYNYIIRADSTNTTNNKLLVETIYDTILITEKLLNEEKLLPELENEFSIFKCRNWISYSRLGGKLSKNRKFRETFYQSNFGKYAKNNLALYHKIEMILYRHNHFIGKLTTRSFKKIQQVFY